MLKSVYKVYSRELSLIARSNGFWKPIRFEILAATNQVRWKFQALLHKDVVVLSANFNQRGQPFLHGLVPRFLTVMLWFEQKHKSVNNVLMLRIYSPNISPLVDSLARYMRGTLIITARNTSDAFASISPSLIKLTFSPRKGKIVSFFFSTGQNFKKGFSLVVHLRVDFHPPYEAYGARNEEKCATKSGRAQSLITVKYSHRKVALLYLLHHLLSASREIVSCTM